MQNWLADLKPALDAREKENLYRHRLILDSAQGPEVKIAGKTFLNFSSNDYLGLANHPSIASVYTEAVRRYGVGAGSSHLVVGHQQPHQQLEEAIAEFLGRDRALVFSSGYMANLGVLSALLGKGDAVFEDRLNHASLLDGGLSSGAKFYRYRHSDLEHLSSLLEGKTAGRKMVAVDGVFSMDGDIAPLDKMATLAADKHAVLMADDAHGFGVLGKNGGGVADHFQLDQQQLPIIMGTLGKAVGVAGAFVAGNGDLIETLVQYARTYIYTTALPASCAAAASESIRIIREEGERRECLLKLVEYFQQGFSSLDLCGLQGIKLGRSISAIQPLIVGPPELALAISHHLYERGILASAIRPPTVPRGTSRLRISLSAAHNSVHIDRLLESLQQCFREQCLQFAGDGSA